MNVYVIVTMLLIVRIQSCTEGSVRLVNEDGSYNNTQYGRLEICHLSNVWIPVCVDDTLCNNVAKVVCNQLGYSTIGAQVYSELADEGIIGFQSVLCVGQESDIMHCNYTGPSTCSNQSIALVSCNPSSICHDIAGYSDCCDTYNCYLSYPYKCWCDEYCHIFDECCPGIELTCPADGGDPVSVGGSGSCAEVGGVEFHNGGINYGRIVVCDTDYKWKTVCSEGFDDAEAQVVCRSLGYNETNYIIYNQIEFGQGTEDVLSKHLNCVGNENHLTDCPSTDICCGHHKDVGLYCQQSCSSGAFRLVNGGSISTMEGRAEVCNDGRWGTVCDDYWDVDDARVACKMAGLPWKGAVAYGGYYTGNNFGSGIGPIWLDNLQCTGSENSLYDCSANDAGDHNCNHYEDAGVKCAPGPCDLANINTCCDPSNGNNCQGSDNEGVCHCSPDCEDHGDCCIDYPLICRCNDYDVRLRGGTVDNEGRVEICVNSEWGTVCDDLWGASDAQVVCRQLGYSTEGAQSFPYAYFGSGTGPVWLDDVQCSGSETHLINCSANAVGSHNCGHHEDAGVRCVSNTAVCVHSQARLVRGPSEYEGQLEVCYNGQWGTVCDDYFGQVDANVGCKNIFPSLPSGGATFIQYSSQLFGWSTLDIVMDNVQCTGTESHIVNCSHITNHNCYHYEDVGLSCYPPGSYDGQVKLNPGPSAGRLMMFTSNSWGTVCWDSFGIEDARVVCRELNLPTQSPRVYRNLQFGRGFGDIKRRIVSCTGNETHLSNCNNYYTYYCSHYSDVGVGCEEPCVDEQIRLVDGDNATEGRVEICRDGSWGTICDNTASWGAEDATVVCKQLGLPYTAAQAKYFGPGADPFHYSTFDCDGGEQSLGACDRDTSPTCTGHTQDVGVVCLGVCLSGNIRLINGIGNNSGRVEVCLGGLWGTVCDENFNEPDAKVICKQLGLPYVGAEVRIGGSFGHGTDHIAMTSLLCEGTENRLVDCFFLTGSVITCSHSNDAGVVCQNVCSNGAVRLSQGEARNAGRVEVCYNGQWGTICDKGWNTNDARVVCYQLGFWPNYVRTFGGSKYGEGYGPIYFRNLTCTGLESNLTLCPGNTVATDVCDHSDDAGVRCDGNELLPSDTLNRTMTPLPAPGMVSNIETIVKNSTAIIVYWRTPDLLYSILTGYKIRFVNAVLPDVSVVGDKPSATINNLKPGIPYNISVTASNVFGEGQPSFKLFYLTELAPNTSVSIYAAERVDEHRILIRWNTLTFSEARGNIVGYIVRWASCNNNTQPLNPTTVTVSSNATSFLIDSLMPSSNYCVSVSAFNTKGIGPPTTPVVIVNTTSYVFFSFKFSLSTINITCEYWMGTNASSKLNETVSTVTQEIKRRCKTCQFGVEYIDNERFECKSDEIYQVLFQAQAFAPNSLTSDIIKEYIMDWLNSGNTSLFVGGVQFSIDQSCSMKGVNDTFCVKITKSNPYITVGIAITSGFVSLIAVVSTTAVIIVAVILVVQKKKQNKQKIGNNKQHILYLSSQTSNSDKHTVYQQMETNDDDFEETVNIISNI